MSQEAFDEFGKKLIEWAIGPELEEQSKWLRDKRSGFAELDRRVYSKLKGLTDEQVEAVGDLIQNAILIAAHRILVMIRDLEDEDGEGVFLVDRRKGREEINLSDAGDVDLYEGLYGEDGWLYRFGPEKFKHLLL